MPRFRPRPPKHDSTGARVNAGIQTAQEALQQQWRLWRHYFLEAKRLELEARRNAE